jgi:ribonuclease HIII
MKWRYIKMTKRDIQRTVTQLKREMNCTHISTMKDAYMKLIEALWQVEDCLTILHRERIK